MLLLPRLLRRIVQVGTLELRGPGGFVEVIEGKGDGPRVTITIKDPSLDWKIPLNAELAAAEAYMDGRMEVGPDGATSLMELIFRNKRAFDMSASQVFWRGLGRRLRRFMQHNALTPARRNVRHHYDLGNAFYAKWLDWDMQYSCAYYPTGQETLEEAQTAKKRHIAAKLMLEPGQRVLDIGSGWGGLALYLAAVADVEVVGVTLSEEQLALARRRAEAAGLSDKVRFELRDYREIDARFDRIVSVGMLEHVGIGHLDGYFRTVRRLLAPDGVALVHSISSADPPSTTGPFLRKYIFPGGYAPCLSEATQSVERAGLWSLDSEIWRVHYSRTLRAWLDRFMAVRADIVAMYDERFARMWEFYLAACEAAFLHGSAMVFQLQLGRQRDAVPLHRDYIGEAEARLKVAEQTMLPRLRRATEGLDLAA
ncbi:MAG: cyclopropane-fatty-acyl-phospholipid synthase family protein [Pseudomonadota bacterium]